MGATKRLAERVLCGLQQKGCTTRFVTVRFGNVLGSNGSVIRSFREQIARRWTGHRDASGYYSLFHADSRSGAVGVTGRVDGARVSKWIIL